MHINIKGEGFEGNISKKVLQKFDSEEAFLSHPSYKDAKLGKLSVEETKDILKKAYAQANAEKIKNAESLAKQKPKQEVKKS